MDDINKLVAIYRKLRDKKEKMVAKHKEELAPVQGLMSQLEIKLMKKLQEMGVESARTDSGTVFLTTTARCRVVDWDSLLSFILENDRTDLLTRAVSKDVVREMLEEEKRVPPGVQWEEEKVVRIRK